MLRKLFISIVLLFSFNSNASLITVEIENGSQPNYYEFHYNITNTSTIAPIDGLTFYFDFGLFQNISLVSSPVNWDFIFWEPELIFGVADPGVVDGIALYDPLTLGQEFDSLVVSFEWLGSTDLFSYVQSYDVYDSVTFDIVSSGSVEVNTSQVPEPSTVIIFVLALVLLLQHSSRRHQGEGNVH